MGMGNTTFVRGCPGHSRNSVSHAHVLWSGNKVHKPVKWLDPAETIFDVFRGDSLSLSFSEVADLCRSDVLSDMLVQSSWAPSTRKLYHGWVLLFVKFCVLLGLCALPADPTALARWVAGLATMYATSTVHVAMSAVIAWHSLHDLPNPVRSSPRVTRLWTAVRRFSGNGKRQKKAVCDHNFVAGMYTQWQQLQRLSLLSWVQIRTMAWFLVGWEAGLRVGELCQLSICCWIRTMAGGVDLKVVQAKNNRWLSTATDRARLKRAVAELAVMPSAVRFIEEVWFPFLAERGVLPWDWSFRLARDGQIKTEGCRFTDCSAFLCDCCPPLFPTFPQRSVVPSVRWSSIPLIETSCSMSMMSRSHVSKQVKLWAQGLGLEGKRIPTRNGRRRR